MRTTGKLRVRTLTDLESVRRLGPEWSELWLRCGDATPFQTPEWLLAWMETYKLGEPWFVEVREGEKLVGLAPMFVNNSGEDRVLRPVGAYSSDYLDWTIEPSIANDVLTTILAYMDVERTWNTLELLDLPGTSALLKAPFPAGWHCERTVENACPVLRLARRIEELGGLLPSHLRRNLRVVGRKLRQAGETRIEVATRETLDEFLGALLRLHRARWVQFGLPGVLADDSVQSFLRRATPALLERGVLRLYGLRCDGRLIATLYAMPTRDVVYCYLQGFDPRYREFSPGAQILAAVIEDAVREGKRAVDFLRGREAYKYTWGARDEVTFRLRVSRKTSLSADLVASKEIAA